MSQCHLYPCPGRYHLNPWSPDSCRWNTSGRYCYPVALPTPRPPNCPWVPIFKSRRDKKGFSFSATRSTRKGHALVHVLPEADTKMGSGVWEVWGRTTGRWGGAEVGGEASDHSARPTPGRGRERGVGGRASDLPALRVPARLTRSLRASAAQKRSPRGRGKPVPVSLPRGVTGQEQLEGVQRV